MSTGSMWQRQEALTHTTAPDRDPAPVPPYLGRWAAGFGCVGCGRLRRGTSAPCGDPPRFSAWDAAQVAAWVSGLGLKDAAQRVLAAGMDGELLLEWQRMRCSAPEAFYQLTRQDLHLGLVDLLRLTRGLTRLCDDARVPLIEWRHEKAIVRSYRGLRFRFSLSPKALCVKRSFKIGFGARVMVLKAKMRRWLTLDLPIRVQLLAISPHDLRKMLVFEREESPEEFRRKNSEIVRKSSLQGLLKLTLNSFCSNLNAFTA